MTADDVFMIAMDLLVMASLIAFLLLDIWGHRRYLSLQAKNDELLACLQLTTSAVHLMIRPLRYARPTFFSKNLIAEAEELPDGEWLRSFLTDAVRADALLKRKLDGMLGKDSPS